MKIVRMELLRLIQENVLHVQKANSSTTYAYQIVDVVKWFKEARMMAERLAKIRRDN